VATSQVGFGAPGAEQGIAHRLQAGERFLERRLQEAGLGQAERRIELARAPARSAADAGDGAGGGAEDASGRCSADRARDMRLLR
jgi:hypothetical protein